jgi:hypothetical protein
VSANEIEYEVEAQLDGARLTLHFHPRCHDAWKAEVESRASSDGQVLQQQSMQTPAA